VLTGVSLGSGLKLSLGAIAIGTGLLSVAVATALGLVLRNFNHADFWVQHDQLTGLPNKEAFRSRLEEVIAGIEPWGGELAVLFLDLDRFKVVNDSLGHSAGDRLLEGVAQRLSASCRPGVDIARLGGDEFGILVHGADSTKRSRSLADEIVNQFKEPFTIDSRALHIAPSIGMASYPTDGRDVEELLRSADSAMYRAKAAGSAQIRVFRPEMHMRAVGRLNLESAMHDAIAGDELEVHYQPQLNASTGAIIGAEALLRWRHPALGLLGPGQFIPIAEETGLIVPIGEWVLGEAAEQMVQWLALVDPGFTMAVNLSPRQLELQNVVDMTAHALRASGLPAERLELEVTESMAMSKRVDLEGTLRGLSELGVSLAIDDFGTGFSGLGYLDRLPIDRIKIDGSFIQAIDAERPDSRLVAAILGLAHTMGLQVVAEGVETVAQRDFLLRHDCCQMQGFLFDRPMPADAFEQVLFSASSPVSPALSPMPPVPPAAAAYTG
jgi:diguanylate cyclase (GGDEF)-like protein